MANRSEVARLAGMEITPQRPVVDEPSQGATAEDTFRRAVSLAVGRGVRRRAEGVLRLACADWGLDAVADDAAIALAELTQNAVRHATCVPVDPSGKPDGRVIGLVLRCAPDRRRLTVCVRDGDPRPPVRRPLGDPADPAALNELAESGRGLWVVAAVADRFGWYPLPPIGKVVWCQFAVPGHAAGRAAADVPSGPGPAQLEARASRAASEARYAL